MTRVSMFLDFYWLCAKQFGRKLYETRLRDFIFTVCIALVTGVAGFLLRDRDWRKAVVIGVVASVLWLVILSLGHFLEGPVLIHSNQKIETNAKKERWRYGFLGIVVGLILVSACGTLLWWWCSERSLESESKDSLRLRTKAAANELNVYLEERGMAAPPFAVPDSNVPNPSPEQQKAIQIYRNYQQETINYYRAHFQDKIIGILKEYDAKGVKTGFLENDATQNMFVPWPNGDPECMSALCRFQELEYHVDAKGERIDIP